MKKKILAFLLILFVTGCQVKYNVTINEDLTVLEQAIIYGDDDLYSTYYKTTKNNVLKSNLDTYREFLNENNYKNSIEESDEPSINLEKKYNDISSYINSSKLFNDYFDKINYSRNGNIIKIETEGFKPCEEDDPNRFYIDELDIAITSKYNVLNHNATRVDKDTNTYHYTIKANTNDFKILLELDTSKEFNPKLRMYTMMVILFIIIVGAWIMVFVLNKKKNY